MTLIQLNLSVKMINCIIIRMLGYDNPVILFDLYSFNANLSNIGPIAFTLNLM